jgi:hypothetical protein
MSDGISSTSRREAQASAMITIEIFEVIEKRQPLLKAAVMIPFAECLQPGFQGMGA